MRAGFLLDRLVSADRNRGVPSSHRLPGGRVVGRGSAIQRFPGLRRRGLTGAAVFHDYVTTEPDRLTFSFALAAAEHGAVLANHVEAVAPLIDAAASASSASRARDTLGGRTIEIAARVTVNATGAGVDRLLAAARDLDRHPDAQGDEPGHQARRRRRSARRTIDLRPQPVPRAVARARAVRDVGIGPRLRARTTRRSTSAMSLAFIAELNQAFPALDLTPGRRHAGAPRRRAGGGPRQPRGARRARTGARSRGARASKGSSASPARSTRPRAPWPSGSPIAADEAAARARCRAGPQRRRCPAAASATSASRSPTRAASSTRGCRPTRFRI